MKKLVLVAAMLLATTGCKSSTEYGECIGIVEDGDPELKYKISVRNAIWTLIGVETLIAPVLWLTDYAKCPVGSK